MAKLFWVVNSLFGKARKIQVYQSKHIIPPALGWELNGGDNLKDLIQMVVSGFQSLTAWATFRR